MLALNIYTTDRQKQPCVSVMYFSAVIDYTMHVSPDCVAFFGIQKDGLFL